MVPYTRGKMSAMKVSPGFRPPRYGGETFKKVILEIIEWLIPF